MEIDTEYTDFITCPYCGYEDRDSWEVEFDNSECGEINCANCDKEMSVTRIVDINYTTKKLKNEKK